MAKMSRNQLKSLIKECLVEVLIEGLNTSSSESFLQEVKTKKISPKRKTTASRTRPALDNVRFDQRVNESVNACTNDPILGNILADTARTTLQEQITEEGKSSHLHQVSMNGDPAAQAASSGDPVDMFGEAANNWAALAFGKV